MKWGVFKYGSIYFALVFAAGFALGTIRVLVVEPRIGTRYAELIEMPAMLFVIYQTAKYVVSKMPDTTSGIPYLIIGATALVFLLLFEFTLVLGLQGLTIDQYLNSRDGIAFSAYIFSLIIFGLMPWLIKIRRNQSDA
jgi:hypothetical protein